MDLQTARPKSPISQFLPNHSRLAVDCSGRYHSLGLFLHTRFFQARHRGERRMGTFQCYGENSFTFLFFDAIRHDDGVRRILLENLRPFRTGKKVSEPEGDVDDKEVSQPEGDVDDKEVSQPEGDVDDKEV